MSITIPHLPKPSLRLFGRGIGNAKFDFGATEPRGPLTVTFERMPAGLELFLAEGAWADGSDGLTILSEHADAFREAIERGLADV